MNVSTIDCSGTRSHSHTTRNFPKQSRPKHLPTNRQEAPKEGIGKHNLFLNGVVLVSPTELGIRRDGPVDEALTLPYMAATAWYHKALAADLQKKDLLEILPEVEQFTIDTYIPALAWGGHLAKEKQTAINWYIRNELNYKTDLEYYMFGPVHPWNGACDYFNAKYNFWQMDKSGKRLIDGNGHVANANRAAQPPKRVAVALLFSPPHKAVWYR